MEMLKAGAVGVFIAFYLLPGLLGTVVYDYLVEGEKRDNFERLLHAFVLTLVSMLIVHGLFNIPLLPAVDIDNSTSMTKIFQVVLDKNLFFISLAATIVAIFFAVLNNHGIIYKVLTRLWITHKVSSSDVWQDVFNRNSKRWVRVVFSDGRTLIGWPRHYSPTGKPRELFIAEATWLENDADGNTQLNDIAGPGVYLSDFSKVSSIEILD